MNSFKKNQIIITALAIMIAVAGYLNFTDKSDLKEDQYVFNNNQDTLDTGALVPNNPDIVTGEVLENPALIQDLELTILPDDDPNTDLVAVSDTIEDDIVGEAVLVNSTAVSSSYFLEAKIDREQTRSMSLEILLEVINNENLGEEQKIQAAAEMMLLQDRIEKEAAAESMLNAKGFEDVFVRMDDETVDVVVNAVELTEIQLAQIADVVSRKTGVDPSKVVITTLTLENDEK